RHQNVRVRRLDPSADAPARARQPCECRSWRSPESGGLLRRNAAARKLEAEALLALAHRPAMIGAEGGSHEPRQTAQERLVGANAPVIKRPYVVAGGGGRPRVLPRTKA